jgi:cell division protein DivIC
MNWKAVKRKALLGLQSKYGLTAAVALIWVTFAADIDLVHILRTAHEVNVLKHEVRRIETETEHVRNDLDELMNNRASLERFARERYYMKRPDEDVYRVVPRVAD